MARPPREHLGPGTVRAQWWHSLPDGRLQCDLCPRECRLAEGQPGFCHVRRAHGGQVVLAAYGRVSGFCVDPIEKKPLYHFLPGTAVLSFGTAGCNLGCRFCQNWTLSKSRDDSLLGATASPEAVARAALREGAGSVAFTYNDPVVFAEYAIDCAVAAREAGLRPVAVTAGYLHPEPRAEFFAAMDAANVDLKAFSDAFYRHQCIGRLEPVLQTLEWIHRESDVWLEVTTLLIPGLNDSPGEIARLCDWYLDRLGPDVPLHFSAFHPDFRLLTLPSTPPATLRRARAQALEAGLRHVYLGNLRDATGQATVCAGCRTRVIGRDGYRLTEWNLDRAGRCRHCGAPVPGIFEPSHP